MDQLSWADVKGLFPPQDETPEHKLRRLMVVEVKYLADQCDRLRHRITQLITGLEVQL